MTVSTIASVAAGLSRTLGNQSNKASSVFDSLLSTTPKKAGADVTANLSAAIELQNQVAQFRVAAKNVAEASTLLAAAGDGASTIAKNLTKMKDLAVRASDETLSADARGKLNSEFQALRAANERIATSTTFNNESLLDGTSPQLKLAAENSGTEDLSVGSLTDAALFKSSNLDLLSANNARTAEKLVAQAQDYVSTQLENIDALLVGLSYAGATLESAIQNQDASRSTLSESDVVSALLGGGSSPIEANSQASLLAQTNRLPDNILQLIAE
jgi:flagellin